MKTISLLLTLAPAVFGFGDPPESPLDRYIREALQSAAAARPLYPGSLYNPNSDLSDLARDLRSRAVNDLVVIHVVERASAISSGDVTSSRQSSLSAGIGSIAGISPPALSNLASVDSDVSLNGAASTGRETAISTSLAARVTNVLPNGYLVVEGTKEVQVNSERQVVTVRGVVRPNDLFNNAVRSDFIAQLEVRVNGKGVVADAIRRPFFLYRLLLGILPL